MKFGPSFRRRFPHLLMKLAQILEGKGRYGAPMLKHLRLEIFKLLRIGG